MSLHYGILVLWEQEKREQVEPAAGPFLGLTNGLRRVLRNLYFIEICFLWQARSYIGVERGNFQLSNSDFRMLFVFYAIILCGTILEA